MAYVVATNAFDILKDRTSKTISDYFPIEGRKNILRAKKVWVEDNLSMDDIRSQKEAKLKGRTWSVPVRAELELVDKATGKVKDTKSITVAQIPKITNRYSYIVGGNEYQINNQFRLKSGAYTRVKANGQLTTQWNLAKGLGFDVNFDPKTKKMTMKHLGKGSNIALYPVLKAMGVDDDTIERQWGREIFNANRREKEDVALKKFYKNLKGENPASPDEARKLVVEEMSKTELRPDSTKITLGKPFTEVTGEALMAGSRKLLRVSRQEERPDDRDSLQFKDLHSAEDLVNERLDKSNARRTIIRKITNTLDKHTAVKDIVNPEFFSKPIKSFFTSSTLSERPDQTNPAGFLVGNRRTTIMGEGGISSDLQVTMGAKTINPSHMGFLDPIQTPECYDKYTEVYTKEGWKPWPEVTESDLLACRHMGGPLMFHRPEALHVSHYEGKMYGLRAGKIEYLVTPNHRMLVSTPWCSEEWRIVEAPRVHGKERRFDCKHEPYISPRVTPEEFHLPVVEGNNSLKTVESLPMEDWAEFMGWYLSEGSCQYKEDTSAYLVRVHQSLDASPDNYQRLQALMDRLPWNWSEQATKTAFATGSKQLASYLKEFGLCHDKYIPDYFFDASVSARSALLEALLLGDGRLGSNRADGRSYKQEVYTTTSARLADDVERLAISLGHSVSRSQYEDRREERYLDVHEVRLLQHRYRTARPSHPNYPANYWTVEYSGKVYCATVPGGLLYVRRGQGIGFWCGNSEKTGVSLQLAAAATKRGKDLVTRAHDLKRGKDVMITPSEALTSNLAFPDQYRWVGGKAVPVSNNIKVTNRQGDITTIKPSEVDYVLKSSKGMFDFGANMIPFLQSDQGNRTMMGVKQLEQAIGLVDREAPMVQVSGEGNITTEGMLGRFVSQRTRKGGTVSKITKDAIYVKRGREQEEIPIYNNFPLNDDKSMLNSEPLVKVGDKVEPGQTVADSNFTRKGELALGTNLRVAYMPFKGYNFEDGIVISESAAQKLTSDHMFRESISSEKNTILNKKKYLAETAGATTKEQADKLDDFGVITPGSIVNQGDVLIGLMKKQEVSPEQRKLGMFNKSFLRPVKVQDVRWEKETPGVVSRVVKHGKKTTVFVNSQAPATIGDKIVGRHGNKGIVTHILPDHEMPQTKDGQATQVLLNPTGIPCYDEETEFLTTEGWVSAKDISMDHTFATLNPKTLVMEFQDPEEVYHMPHKGSMYCLRNQQLDMMVTPNHKQFSARRGNQKLSGPLDLDDPELPALFELKEAREIAREPRRYLKAAKWQGDREFFYHIPAGAPAGGGKPAASINVASIRWAEFMGWYLSEGSTYFNKANYGYIVEISQSREANPESYERIETLLQMMGVNYEANPTNLRIKHKGLYERLSPLGGARDKFIPREILDLTPDHLSVFLDTLVAGDGSETWNEETGHYGCRTYWTSSKRLADGVQEVAAKLGIAANIKRETRRGDDACYYIALSSRCLAPWVNWSSTTKAHQYEEWVQYDGMVHCATVPNGVLLVRRNGKAVFSGNTRINVGQVLETAAAKISEKTGKPYKVNNFDPDNQDYTRNLMKELKQHGISDTEEVVDPVTGKSFGKVLTGPQYILKLHHTAAKGLSARSRHAYDSNMTPKGGGPQGGQTMDAMGMYAMLAHNARENIREMQTYKSDNNDAFWDIIQSGDAPPAPKVPFVYKKFEGYLKAMGVDVQKEGNDLILQPLTDKQVLEMSNGELKDPSKSFRGKDLKPEVGGLFDTKVTGTRGLGSDLGTKWSHIKLNDRMPNPVFEGPISSLIGISKKDIDQVVAGKKEVKGKTGPGAITDALKGVNVEKETAALEESLPRLRTSALNKANKKLKYLRALKRAGVTPVDAYTMKNLPVLPPVMRPAVLRDDGDLVPDGLNKIYGHIGKSNYQLQTFDPGMPEEEKHPLWESLYDGIKGLTLSGIQDQGKHHNSIAQVIAGTASPKEGFFQKRLIGRRQDMSMRGTIVPEPSLSLDEVAIPRKAAAEIYKPFVVANLVNRRGYPPLLAQQKVKEDGVEARSALEEVAAERPLLLKRDPVLHKYGVQAFRPKLIGGKAIKIHPLATTGYNADFDGDKMSAYVPVSQKAVKEAWKMLPSNNLFSPSTGFVMYKPTQESMQGLFKLTEMGKSTNRKFKSAAEAAQAVRAGTIGMNDVITVENVGKGVLPGLDKLAAAKRTTVGRMMVYNALPEGLRSDKVLSDKEFVLTKGNLQNVLTDVAAAYYGDFGTVSDKLKDLGNAKATGLSVGLEDFVSDKEYRDKVLDQARKKEAAIRADKRLSPDKRDEKIVELYTSAGKDIDAKAKAKADAKPGRMYDWIRSGARGSWDNYKQMTVAPMMVADTTGKPIPVPIDKSYSEGLDIGSYWASMYGARTGTISRAEGTWRPGLISKQMMRSTMDQMIVSEDCGTTKGIALPLSERDILGRFTAHDIKLKKGGKVETVPAGTVIDPDVVNRLKNNRVTEVPVRTPLRCSHGKGLCAKCYGLNENAQLHPRGVNVGVIAAQALGEPATQLSMNSFHTGGVVGAKGTTALGTFDRVNQLLQVPEILPGAATLSQADGKVEKVDKDVAGGWSVFVSGQRHYVPQARGLAVKKGQAVKKGDAISTGVKNPKELLPLTGMPTVQRYLTDELHGIYKDVAPVRRRNTETFIRAMTNLSKITDPGDHEVWLPGDTAPTSEISKFNSQKPAGSKRVESEPVLHGVSVLPLEMQTDWLARMQSTNLRSTILDASAEGWRSALHSTHPIPGMAYGASFGQGTKEEPWLY